MNLAVDDVSVVLMVEVAVVQYLMEQEPTLEQEEEQSLEHGPFVETAYFDELEVKFVLNVFG